jgi:hypothetical protein
MLVILPLGEISVSHRVVVFGTHQKLKKSLTSFSLVSWDIPLTWTVVDMFEYFSVGNSESWLIDCSCVPMRNAIVFAREVKTYCVFLRVEGNPGSCASQCQRRS